MAYDEQGNEEVFTGGMFASGTDGTVSHEGKHASRWPSIIGNRRRSAACHGSCLSGSSRLRLIVISIKASTVGVRQGKPQFLPVEAW